MSGLFALFCDDIDSDAYCPNEGSCCMPAGTNDEKQEVITTTSRPTTVSLFKISFKNGIFTTLLKFLGDPSKVSRILFTEYYGCILRTPFDAYISHEQL